MKLTGQYVFDAPQRAVWDALQDPVMLASTLPGCDALTRNGNEFRGQLNVKVGPIQGKFDGKVDLTELAEPERFTMLVDGRGAPGFVKANAKVALAPEGERTRIDYDADVTVGGKIASVGQRLLEASARAIVKQSLEGLNERLKFVAAPAEVVPAEPAPPAAEAAPTAGDLAPPPPPPAVAPTAVPGADLAPPPPPPAAQAPSAGEPPPPPMQPPPPPLARPMPPPPTQAEFAARVAKEVTKELLPPRTLALIAVVLVLLVLALSSLF